MKMRIKTGLIPFLLVFVGLAHESKSQAYIAGPNYVCLGQEATYTIEDEPYAYCDGFSWSVSGGTITSQNRYSVTVTWGTNPSTTKRINYNGTGCSEGGERIGGTAAYVVSLNITHIPPAPTVSINANNQFTGTTIVFTLTPSIPNVTYQVFSQPTGGSPLASSSSSIPMVTTSPGTITHYFGGLLCSSTSTSRSSKTVNYYSFPNIASSGNLAAGVTSTLSLANSSQYPIGTTYKWFWNDIEITSASAPSYTANQPGTYKCQVMLPGSVAATSNAIVLTTATASVSAGATTSKNRVITTQYRVSGITSHSSSATLPVDQFESSITYMDGLGRTSQIVHPNSTPTLGTIIDPYEYDAEGRIAKSYLPYERTATTTSGAYDASSISNQLSYYQNPPPGVAGISVNGISYSESKFDKSPLNRVLEQALPGESWKLGSEHTGRTTYRGNTTADAIPRFKVTDSGQVQYLGLYLPGDLLAVRNEEHHARNPTIHFYDKSGRLIAERTLESGAEASGALWNETLNVYDDFGRLRVTYQPIGSRILRARNFSDPNYYHPNQPYLNAGVYTFNYVYDSRGRLVEKKVPDADWSYTVYDNLNRPILTQPPNLRAANEWFFTKYDALNRVVYTGIYTFNGTVPSGQNQRQAVVAAMNSSTDFSEDPTANPAPATASYTDLENYTNNMAGTIVKDPAYANKWVIMVNPANWTYAYEWDSTTNTVKIYSPNQVKVIGVFPENFLGQMDAEGSFLNVGGSLRPIVTRASGIMNDPGKWVAVHDMGHYKFTTTTNVQTGYSNTSFPTTSIQPQIINFYDTYDFDKNGTADVPFVSEAGYPTEYVANPWGKATGSKVMYLDNVTGTGPKSSNYPIWLEKATWFDDRGRLVQYYKTYPSQSSVFDTIADNQRTFTQYNFMGQSVKTKTVQDVLGLNTNSEYRYEYDHAGRMTQLFHGDILLGQYSYNGLEQLIEKNLHSTNNGASFRYSIDYRYHIRGWLKSVNQANLTLPEQSINQRAITPTILTPDLFGEEYSYDESTGIHPERYDGKLAMQTFSDRHNFGGISPAMVAYHALNYDQMGRYIFMQTAERQITGSTLGAPINLGKFEEIITGYDANSNVTGIKRYGGSNGLSTIDNLVMQLNGNQLRSVSDSVTSGNGFDFRDLGNTNNEYTFSTSGYMVAGNSGDTEIFYNRLNQPNYVYSSRYSNSTNPMGYGHFYSLRSIYDATGAKYIEERGVGDSHTKILRFGAFTYSEYSFELLSIETPEGTWDKETNSYDFRFTDRLNSTRAVGNSLGVAQEYRHYYGSGQPIYERTVTSPGGSTVLHFQSKRDLAIPGLLWQDHGFRMADPQLMRWNGVDPLADYQTFESTYAYMGADPVNLIDPTGGMPRDPMDNGCNYCENGSFEIEGIDITADAIHPQWGYSGALQYAWSLNAVNNTPSFGNINFQDQAWGNGIHIIGRGRKDIAIYKDGKLFNLDGITPYNGRSLRLNERTGLNVLRGFMNAAVVALKTAADKSKTAAALLITVSNLKDFYITSGSVNRTSYLPFKIDGKSVLGIEWNASLKLGGTDVNGNTSRPPWLGLVHELAHVYSRRTGTADYTTWFTVNTADGGTEVRSRDEWWATHLENQVRFESGLPLRKYYGVGGSPPLGQILYDRTNTSIYYMESRDVLYDNPFEWDHFEYGVSLFVFPISQTTQKP